MIVLSVAVRIRVHAPPEPRHSSNVVPIARNSNWSPGFSSGPVTLASVVVVAEPPVRSQIRYWSGPVVTLMKAAW